MLRQSEEKKQNTTGELLYFGNSVPVCLPK
jgi:hypothetical protein